MLKQSADDAVRVPYVVGYFVIGFGLLMTIGVTLVVLLPFGAAIALLWVFLGGFGIVLGTILAGPIWLWFAFRFFFPVVVQMIWIDSRPVLFVLDRANPKRIVRIVMVGLDTLGSDARSFSKHLGNWLNG